MLRIKDEACPPRIRRKRGLRILCFFAALLLIAPLPAFGIFDFGGWVLNVPTSGGVAGRAAAAAHAAEGTVIYPPCVNAVEEVNIQSPPLGLPSPPVLLQFVGNYRFLFGPAKFVGQKMLGKYMLGGVCMATQLLRVPCGPAICIIPVVIPLFVAPTIIWNGSSLR